MSTKSVIEEAKEEIVDDMPNEIKPSEEIVDDSKLAALKAKNQAKQQEQKMAAKIVAKKERSLNFGVLGSGQSGGNLASEMFSLGYSSIACNTALQDLKFLNLPDSNKLLLDQGIMGAAKDLEIGRTAAESYRGEIRQLINEKLADSQVNIFCTSLGGGSGAGSCETMIDILGETGKPVVVITVLPMTTEDSQTKSNALQTLAKLTKLTKDKKVHNLIVVDNAKIESIYHNVNQMDFYTVANKAIVAPLDAFNTLSAMPSSVKGMDGMEFSKLLLDGEGLSVYGEFKVNNYSEDTAIAEAVVNNLNNNLLASGFDLKQAKYVGFVVTANKQVWRKIPASSINYATAMVNDLCGSPQGVFKGIYTVDSDEDCVNVYSFFSGLGLPQERVDGLKKETAELQMKNKSTTEQRNLNLQVNAGTNETISDAQKVKDKIAAKSSVFGKFVGNNVVDRRK